VSRAERYVELFDRHRSPDIPALWPWQREVLGSYEKLTGDAAVELPTGTGKTLIGLLAGEDYRSAANHPVAYLAGNKQLARQIERQANDHNFPVVRFQDKKETWDYKDVRAYNFGRAIGVMNYWNYFNANPGVEPAGMLILDDVHLLEGPLRDYLTVFVPAGGRVCRRVLGRVVARCPYYRMGAALLKVGQFGRGWLCRLGLGLLVAAVVVALFLLFEVEGEVFVEVVVAGESAELEDGFGAVEAPSGACYLHAVLDDSLN
jgi:hypothetical protein